MTSLQEHLAPNGAKRILSLDGGGTLGVMEIAFLEKIEAILRERYRKPELRLCEYFDLIGGTSTGAIIATALALGKSAAEVKDLYFKVGPKAFRKSWFAHVPILGGIANLIRPQFKARGLQEILTEILGDRELQTPDLKTGLAIISKRMDTGSPWVLTNNPKSIYWEGETTKSASGKGNDERIGNKRYLLRNVVRASTAAPYFFAPQQLQIFTGRLKGLFVDGGVSPYNNPSLQLLMLAGVSRYGFDWKISKNDLLLISVGAGWARPKISPWQARYYPSALLAVKALHGVIWDSNVSAIMMLQWMSNPRKRWPINSEVLTLAGDSLARDAGGGDLLTFQRYDVGFEPQWVRDEMGEDLSEREIARINDFMNPAIMQDAYTLASRVAATQVDAADFPTAFDIIQ